MIEVVEPSPTVRKAFIETRSCCSSDTACWIVPFLLFDWRWTLYRHIPNDLHTYGTLHHHDCPTPSSQPGGLHTDVSLRGNAPCSTNRRNKAPPNRARQSAGPTRRRIAPLLPLIVMASSRFTLSRVMSDFILAGHNMIR